MGSTRSRMRCEALAPSGANTPSTRTASRPGVRLRAFLEVRDRALGADASAERRSAVLGGEAHHLEVDGRAPSARSPDRSPSCRCPSRSRSGPCPWRRTCRSPGRRRPDRGRRSSVTAGWRGWRPARWDRRSCAAAGSGPAPRRWGVGKPGSPWQLSQAPMPRVVVVERVAERPGLDDRLRERELRAHVLGLALVEVDLHEVTDRHAARQPVLHAAGVEPLGDLVGA